ACSAAVSRHPSAAEIYPLSLHDALPISLPRHLRARILRSARRLGLREVYLAAHAGGLRAADGRAHPAGRPGPDRHSALPAAGQRSEEHTSELQSRENLVCRLLLEKKNKR